MRDVFISTMRTRLVRQLRRPGLWVVALLAPIAAHWLVPEPGSSYAILAINGFFVELDAPALGLQLGVITATLLLPLAYMYLRTGQARKAPWPILDAAPHARPAYTLATWAADTLTLWIVLAALALAGWLLALFRFPQAVAAPHEMAVTLMAIGAPALALVAALVTVFDARPWLRSWPGDVLFFFIWMALILIGIAPSFSGGAMQSPQPFADPLGFVPALIGASPQPIEELVIGASAASADTLKIDALKGILTPGFLTSRLFWIVASGVLALASGIVYAPHAPAKAPKRRQADQKPLLAIPAAPPARVAALPFAHQIASDIRLLLASRPALVFIAAAALAGAFLPFRTIAAPMVFLSLIFPMANAGARLQARTLVPLLSATGTGLAARTASLMAAGTLTGLAAFFPAITSAAIQGNPGAMLHAGAISAGTALAATALGGLSKSGVPARLSLLVVWYGYLSAATGN